MKLKECIDQIRAASASDDQPALVEAIALAFKLIVCSESLSDLRDAMPAMWDFEVPTRLVFAIHIQVLRQPNAEQRDRLLFADFLSAYYEEWDDWARALRAVDN